MKLSRALVLAAALGPMSLLLPAPALADVSVAPAAPVGTLLVYDTKLTPRYGAGEYGGVLRITISPAGIVHGFYINDDGDVSTVTGGVRGAQIWFDVANYGKLHVNGTIEKNRIVGYSLQRSDAFTAKLTARN